MKKIKKSTKTKVRRNFRVSKAAIGTILLDYIDAGTDGSVSAEEFMATMMSLHDYIEDSGHEAGEDVDSGLWTSFKARVDKSAERSAAARLRWDRIRAERAAASALAAPLEVTSTLIVPAQQGAPVVASPSLIVPAQQVAPTVVAPVVPETTAATVVSAPEIAANTAMTPASETKPVEVPATASADAAVTEAAPQPELSEEMKRLLRHSPLRPYKVTDEMRRAGVISVEEKGYIRFEKEGYTGKELKKRVEEYVHEVLVRRRQWHPLPQRGWF